MYTSISIMGIIDIIRMPLMLLIHAQNICASLCECVCVTVMKRKLDTRNEPENNVIHFCIGITAKVREIYSYIHVIYDGKRPTPTSAKYQCIITRPAQRVVGVMPFDHVIQETTRQQKC